MRIEITAPEVPFSGGTTQPEFMRRAAKNLREGYQIGGSNVTLTVARLMEDVARAMETPEPVTEETTAQTGREWIVWAGGSDADNCAVSWVTDDEAEAHEKVQWMDGSHGRGIAVRAVTRGLWTPVEHDHSTTWAEADADTAQEVADR